METRKSRETLKSYFRTGMIPTESQFSELIDSVPNFVEDGHVKSGPTGAVLFPHDEAGSVAAVYAAEPVDGTERPLWTLCAGARDELLFRNAVGEDVLTLRQDRSVSFAAQVTVERQVTADDFLRTGGVAETVSLAANGRWHDLPVEAAAQEYRPGCRVYGVFVYYRDPDAEYFRLVQAVASRCDGQGTGLTSPRKHWWGWGGPVSVRWKRGSGGVLLQVRGRRSTVAMQCRVTEIWNYTE